MGGWGTVQRDALSNRSHTESNTWGDMSGAQMRFSNKIPGVISTHFYLIGGPNREFDLNTDSVLVLA